jgi:4-hydroxybenzoate polyprenyltransferase
VAVGKGRISNGLSWASGVRSAPWESLLGAEEEAETEPRFRRPIAFFWLLRLNRTAMVAMITGAAAFAAGSGVARSLRMALAGWCLAVGGLSLDFYADRDLDIEGPRAETRHNPLSDGSLSPSTGLAFSATFIGASFVMVAQLAALALLPWGAILAVVLGLALHLFETPVPRALTLGLLQTLYVLLGARPVSSVCLSFSWQACSSSPCLGGEA